MEAIKNAIAGLGEDERHSLAVWLNELDSDAWDKQMAQDFAPGGRGANLLDKVKADIAADKFHPVEELCPKPKQRPS